MTEFPRISARAARVNAGMTLEEASKKIGVNRGTLIKYENQVSDWAVRWDDPKNGMWNPHKTTTYTWADVARKIIELIIMDEY